MPPPPFSRHFWRRSRRATSGGSRLDSAAARLWCGAAAFFPDTVDVYRSAARRWFLDGERQTGGSLLPMSSCAARPPCLSACTPSRAVSSPVARQRADVSSAPLVLPRRKGIKLDNFKCLVASGARRAAETLEVRIFPYATCGSTYGAALSTLTSQTDTTHDMRGVVHIRRSWLRLATRRARAPQARARPSTSSEASTPRCVACPGRCRQAQRCARAPSLLPALTHRLERSFCRESPPAARSCSTSSTTARSISFSRRCAATLLRIPANRHTENRDRPPCRAACPAVT